MKQSQPCYAGRAGRRIRLANGKTMTATKDSSVTSSYVHKIFNPHFKGWSLILLLLNVGWT